MRLLRVTQAEVTNMPLATVEMVLRRLALRPPGRMKARSGEMHFTHRAGVKPPFYCGSPGVTVLRSK